MTDDQAFERAVSEWLEAGSDRTSPHVADAVLLAIRSTPQERDLRIPWRPTPMTPLWRVAAAIVIVAIAGVAALSFSNRSTGPGSEPTPSMTATPSLSPSPSLNPLLDTSTWTTYTSTQYGFTIGHPTDWTIRPAERAWDLDMDGKNWLSPATDSFINPTGDVRMSVWKLPLPQGTVETWETREVETWYEDVYCPKTDNTSCSASVSRAIPLCLEARDCHPGILIASHLDDTQAFFSLQTADGMTVVSIWRTDNDPSVERYGGGRKLLEAFLSTMNVWPKDALPSLNP